MPVESAADRASLVDVDEFGAPASLRSGPLTQRLRWSSGGSFAATAAAVPAKLDAAPVLQLEEVDGPFRAEASTPVDPEVPHVLRVAQTAPAPIADVGTFDAQTGALLVAGATLAAPVDVDATLELAAVPLVGILEREHVGVDLESDVPVSSRGPTYLTPPEGAAEVIRRAMGMGELFLDVVTALGTEAFRIDDAQPDGTGFVLLVLHGV